MDENFTAFAAELADYVGHLAKDNAKFRNGIKEVLKAPKRGHQARPPVDYLMVLADYAEAREDLKLGADAARTKLAAEYNVDTVSIKNMVTHARKLFPGKMKRIVLGPGLRGKSKT